MAEKTAKSTAKDATGKPERPPLEPGPDGIVRLTGGNPQIAKGDGDGPVQAFITAMPGWQSEIGREMDAIITGIVPDVFKSVKWNTPFFGTEPKTWFVSFHCMTRYIKVAFPDGTSLDPLPPGTSKQKTVRYLDIYEGKFDAEQFTDWIRQASQLSGESF